MKFISKYKKMLVDRLEAKGLEKLIIPSFIRSLRICLVINPALNHLKLNKELRLLGWNDIEMDYHTLQISIACFEEEGAIIRSST